MDLLEFAELLESAGSKLKEPAAAIPPASDQQLIKDALLNEAKGGIKALQVALRVAVDGIIGPNTQGALDKIEINTLLTNLATPPVSSSDFSFKALAPEYRRLYNSMNIDADRIDEVDSIVAQIRANFPRYDSIALQTGVSPNIIGIIHSLESSLRFSRHFHNGDPLSGRTVNVPAGRPPPPSLPPFSWEESVLDAITLYGLDKWVDWSPEGIAYTLEQYNGWGYRRYHPEVKTPYLWSFTDVYTGGKYDVDGHFDPGLVSQQCGGMALLKGLLQ